MSGNISLTASMRSNLLSLQNISRTVGATQNKLATGNKVNSAIDNPSSYYTARSLNNRANDLDALLDSMGQAVSTIKTATTALETGATFLEQAAAVATSALETPQAIPEKEYFMQLIGANDAVVSTAAELDQALAAGKETICVYGKIDLEQAIKLRDNQKLVGINYFANFTGLGDYFSELNYTSNAPEDMITINGNNAIVSDLNIKYTNTYKGADYLSNSALCVYNRSASSMNVVLNNLDIDFNFSNKLTSGAACIKAYSDNTNLAITGNVKMQTLAWGIFAESNSNIKIQANLNVSAAQGIVAHNNGHAHISSNSVIEIKNSNVAFSEGSSNSIISVADDVCIGIYNCDYIFRISPLSNTISFSKGVSLVNHNTKQAYYLEENINITSGDAVIFDKFVSNLVTSDIDYKQTTQRMEDSFFANNSGLFNWQNQIKQYTEILNQYDTLVKDSSYKGVNLLKNDKLNVRFNEKGNADLNVNGKDMSAGALGLNTVDWQNQGDIAQSLKEIAGALKSIRAFTAELGNNYSIITNRHEFTENLINILTEGADKLTLADMNEESANMLSLQTRQQLAINSLSLASQAAQAVLKLF